MIYYRFAGLDLCYADPAQPLTTADEQLDDLDHDLSDLSEVGKSAKKYHRSRVSFSMSLEVSGNVSGAVPCERTGIVRIKYEVPCGAYVRTLTMY